MLFLRLLCLAATGVAGFLQDIQPGIYKERLEEVRLLANSAEVYTKIEIKGLRDDIDNLMAMATQVDKKCRKSVIPDLACDNFKNLTLSINLDTEKRYDAMTQERSRRGLINVIGSGAKLLFGTMDSHDSEKISRKLQSLFDEQGKTADFKDTYIKIIEKTISKINETTDVINHHAHALDILENRLTEVERSGGAAREAYLLLDVKNSYMILAETIKSKIDTVHQTLIDLHNNILNTRLLAYKDLVEALKKIKIEDPDVMWPLNLDEPSHEILRKLLKFAVFKLNEDLMIVFTLPLIETEKFHFTKLYSVPKIENNIGTFINVEAGLIISNDKLSKFASLSNQDKDKNCVHANEKAYCKRLNLLSTDMSSCLGTVIAESMIDVNHVCPAKIFPINRTILVKTEDINKYLVFSSKPTKAKLMLKNKKTILSFDRTQLLEVNQEATLLVDNFVVKFFHDRPKTNLSISVTIGWFPHLDDIQFSELPQAAANSNRNILVNKDFADLGQDLKQLKKKMNNDAHEQSRTKIFTISGITIGIIISILAVTPCLLIAVWWRKIQSILMFPNAALEEAPQNFVRMARGRATA